MDELLYTDKVSLMGAFSVLRASKFEIATLILIEEKNQLVIAANGSWL